MKGPVSIYLLSALKHFVREGPVNDVILRRALDTCKPCNCTGNSI